MTKRLVIGAALAGAVGIAVALASEPASSQEGQVEQAPVLRVPGDGAPLPEAADKKLGMAVMGAVVLADGELFSDWHGGVSSTEKLGTGRYRILFRRDIIGCIPVLTTWTTGTADLSGYLGNGAGYNIDTRSSTGALADAVFNILVFCPK